MSPTKREVTLRDDGDERVWVEWVANTPTPSFVQLRSERRGDELRMLALDTNELSQLRRAVEAGEDDSLARDMGAFERVAVERTDGFVTITVEQLGEVERMLVLSSEEADTLLDAIARAEDELPRTEDDAYV